jgi:hypothetical protein
MTEAPKTKKAVKPAVDISPESVREAKRTYSQQEFLERYNALCAETGWQLAATATPGLKPLNDLGGYIIVTQVQFSVTPVQK